MNPRTVAIVQARMNSSRLPGKVLLDIAGQPMLARVVSRAARAASVDQVVLATTTDASDDPVASYCRSKGIPCTRGDQFDVLDRYYQAARKFDAEVLVRVTADCPAIDPGLIDEVVAALLEGGRDFACNRLPPPWHRSYPIGLDTEACTFAALERAWKEAQEPQQREHVMPYFYENAQLSAVSDRLSAGTSPRGFRIALLNHVPDYGQMRWTVDTAQDLEFIRQVYARFAGRDDFTWKDVLVLVGREPKLAEINSAVRHKTLEDIDKRALKR
jgi:spore coat polysaccharide biosynthesis protein SpsF